jgi:dTDP-4-amino-4,6-dideoxygalactose transaminase
MIPFSPPRIDDKIINSVKETLLSGWLTTGPKTKLFEKKIGHYCKVENVLAVNSWTAGAELILYWFGIKPGDEVIVPAYTYCATANIIHHLGAKVIMVDVNTDFGIDINALEDHITENTKAIIPVDIAGFPIDYEYIYRIINKKVVKDKFKPENKEQKKLGRILILSDSAHSFGSFYMNKKNGSYCDFTVFSFHAVKNLTTGEGGAICINLPSPFDNNEIYNQFNTLTLHGQNKDALAKTQIGNWEYDVIDAGFKCNMTDVLASIGLVELERYDTETLPKRKHIFNKYTNLLKKYPWFIEPISVGIKSETSYHLYLLRIKNITIIERNNIISEIFNCGVSVNVHYKPLPLLSFYKNKGYDINNFPVAKSLWETEISLPIYYDLSDENILTIVESVAKSVNKIITTSDI